MFRRLRSSGRRPPAAVLTLILLTSLLFGLAACKPPSDRAGAASSASASSGGLSAAIEVEAAPRIGEVPLTVTVLDDGQPLSGATVRIVGDMTHAGMQPVLRDAVEVSPGSYQANDFAFTMAGDWIITATITTRDGRRTNAELFTNVPAR